jgi:hypothetical protein
LQDGFRPEFAFVEAFFDELVHPRVKHPYEAFYVVPVFVDDGFPEPEYVHVLTPCYRSDQLMRGLGVTWRWVEWCLVGLACVHSTLHCVVHLQDDTLDAVLAVGLLVVAFDYRECVHNVVDVVAGDAVEVEERGV